MSAAIDSRIAPPADLGEARDEDGLTAETRRRIREYVDTALAGSPPLTPQQVETVVALLRPTSRRTRHPDELTR